MQHDPPAENFLLDCDCGEKMVIFGQVEDWLARHPIFRCNCGEKLTFSDEATDEAKE